MLHANFQLLIPILTILLHLCCSWPPPRLAHDSTFMLSDQFYVCCERKQHSLFKDLYKTRLLHTFFHAHTNPRNRTSHETKCCCFCGKCTKVMFATVVHATFRANAGNNIVGHAFQSNTARISHDLLGEGSQHEVRLILKTHPKEAPSIAC